MLRKKIAVLLAVVWLLGACSSGVVDGGGAGDEQGSSNGAVVNDGESESSNGASGGDSLGGGSSSDDSTGSGSSDTPGGSDPASGSDGAEGDSGSLHADSQDWFPTDKRCQVEGNETMDVPGGTLVSVDVFNVESGERLQSVGGIEGLDELLDQLADREAILQKLRNLSMDINDPNLVVSLAAVGEVAAEDFFHTEEYREVVKTHFATCCGGDNSEFFDTELSEARIAELAAKATSQELNEDELEESEKYRGLAAWLIAPFFAYPSADSWSKELAEQELENLSFICGYLFEMGAWNELVSHWQSSVPWRDLAPVGELAFVENVNRVHAGGDWYSFILNMIAAPESLPEVKAKLALVIAEKVRQAQSFGVTMAGVGTQGEDGYPFIYVTVKDGGQEMFETLGPSTE